MNILCVDTEKITVEEASQLHERVQEFINDDLITLPLGAYLLTDVDLRLLYELRSIIDSAIKEKENGANS